MIDFYLLINFNEVEITKIVDISNKAMNKNETFELYNLRYNDLFIYYEILLLDWHHRAACLNDCCSSLAL